MNYYINPIPNFSRSHHSFPINCKISKFSFDVNKEKGVPLESLLNEEVMKFPKFLRVPFFTKNYRKFSNQITLFSMLFLDFLKMKSSWARFTNICERVQTFLLHWRYRCTWRTSYEQRITLYDRFNYLKPATYRTCTLIFFYPSQYRLYIIHYII